MSITKKIRTKFLSLMLVLSVVITGLIPTTAVFASEITEPGTAVSTAVLTSEGLIMNVTVPTSVLIYVDENGEVTTPDYLPIINDSIAPVFVHSLTVTPKNGWTLDPTNTDYTNFKTNRKNYWLAFNGLDPSSEPIALATPIYGSDSLNLVLSADVAPQRTATTALNIGEIVITLDWDAAEGAQEGNQEQEFSIDGATYTAPRTYVVNFNAPEAGLYFVAATLPNDPAPEDPYSAQIMQFVSVFTAGTQEKTVLFDAASEEMKDADIYIWRMNDEGDIIGPLKTTVREEGTGGNDEGQTGNTPEGYVLATDGDFVKKFWYYEYIGEDEYIILPDLVHGEELSVYTMFMAKPVKGVRVDNPNLLYLSSMFFNSPSETLDLSGINTSNVLGMNEMFYNASATSINLTGWDTSNVTNMKQMFRGAKATTLDLSHFNTSKVTDMSFMFLGAEASSLNVSGFDTSNVTDMISMFNLMTNLTNLNLSSFDTSNVTNMSSMFEDMYSLETLDLSPLNTSKVTNMRLMFSGNGATTLDLSGFNTSNVTDMSEMFAGAKATTLDLSGFNTDKVENMDSMFWGAEATTIDISSFNLADTQPTVSGMFNNSEATTVYVRSQADIDYITANAGNIPATLNFVVK